MDTNIHLELSVDVIWREIRETTYFGAYET